MSQGRHHFPLFMGHPNWDTVVRQPDVTSEAPFPREVCVCVLRSNSAACPVASSAVSCLSGPACLGWLAPRAHLPRNPSPTPRESGGAPTCAQPGVNPQVRSAGWQELPVATPLFSPRFQLGKSGREQRQTLPATPHWVFIARFFRVLPAYRLTVILILF